MPDGEEEPTTPAPRELALRPMPPTTRHPPIEQGLRLGFGVAALVVEVVMQALVGPEAKDSRTRGVVDTGLGAAWAVARAGSRVTAAGVAVVAPVGRTVLRPPLIPRSLQVGTALDALTERWVADRPQLALEASRTSTVAVPAALDAVASTVDLDALVAGVIDRLDVNRLVQHVLARVDLDEAVTQAVNDLDLTPIVHDAIRRVDLQPIASEIIDELDLGSVVGQVLEQVDLTTLVIEKVDLGQVVNKALDDLDLTALVMERVDLVGVADYVVDAIDLPGIVRESTGSIAAETVRTVRLQAVDADRMLARMVDRFTLRGGRSRRLDAPGEPESSDQGPGV